MKQPYRPPAPNCYRLTPGTRIVQHETGMLAISSYPLRVIKLTRLAAQVLQYCASEHTSEELAYSLKLPPQKARALCEQLWRKDLLEAGPALPPPTWPAVSIIIPSYNRAVQLERCLRSLYALDYPQQYLEILVVDDASTDETASMLQRFTQEPMMEHYPLRVVTHTTRQGVASSRNTGAEAANYSLLAYIDSDCVASPGWLAELVPALQDTRIAAVGGMIRSYDTISTLGRYEDVRSSLFMGVRTQQVRREGPLTYLPTANIVVRREAWQQIGGFAPLTFGEDVDFCRRLLTNNFQIRYLPQGTVYHDYRTRPIAFLNIRASYASAEAALLRRHPTERRILLLPPEQAAFAVLAITGLWGLLLAFIRFTWGNGNQKGQCRTNKEHAPCMVGQDGRPQGRLARGKHRLYRIPFVVDRDGRPQKKHTPFVVEPDGRPQKKHTPFVVEPDGRPQGAPPSIHTAPVPTICGRAKATSSYSRDGGGVEGGGAPCGRPSPNYDSLYLNSTAPGGRPSPNYDSLYLNSIASCGRPFWSLFMLPIALLLTFIGANKRHRQIRKQRIPINLFTTYWATLRSNMAYTYHLCRHLTRYYTLAMLAIGLLLPPLLLLALILCGIVIGVDYARLRPAMGFGRYALCSLLDDCAYEVGVARGCIKHRTWKPLVPVMKKRI